MTVVAVLLIAVGIALVGIGYYQIQLEYITQELMLRFR